MTTNLEAMAAALAPFKDLTIEQLSEILKVACEYRQTGQLPDWILGKKPAASRARAATTKAPKLPKMTPDEAVAKLRNLQSQSPYMEPDRITQEVQSLKALNMDDLKAVQKEFLGAVTGKKKDDHLAAIERAMLSYRESQIRSKDILNS